MVGVRKERGTARLAMDLGHNLIHRQFGCIFGTNDLAQSSTEVQRSDGGQRLARGSAERLAGGAILPADTRSGGRRGSQWLA